MVALMDGTPEHTWHGRRNALEMHCVANDALRPAQMLEVPRSTISTYKSQVPPNAMHLTKYHTVFCTDWACDTWSETWGTPGASPMGGGRGRRVGRMGGDKDGGKGVSGATQSMARCTELCDISSALSSNVTHVLANHQDLVLMSCKEQRARCFKCKDSN